MSKLYSFYGMQQTLDQAETPAEVATALTNILKPLIPEATIKVSLDASPTQPDLSALASKAITTQEPQTDSDGKQIVVPLVKDDQCRGLIHVEKGQPFTDLELSVLLGQAQCAAVTLDRLSWPASPLVFRQLVENANVAIDVADLGGKITYANAAAAQMYGYDEPKALVGRSTSELYADTGDRKVRATIDDPKFADTGWISEITQKNASGSPFPVKLALFGLHDPRNKTSSFGAILQDVGEHHRLVKSLQQQTRRLESLNRVGTLLSSSLNRDRLLAMASEQVVKLLNVDHCSIAVLDEKGQSASVVAEYPGISLENRLVPIADNPMFDPKYADDVIVSPDIESDSRLASVRAFMEDLGIKSFLTARLEVKGKQVGALTLVCNREKRTFTEEEIETARTLANQIALALENSDLYGQALAANHLKSIFLQNISHELRTPLNAILGFTETILSGIYGQISEKQQDRLQRVHRHAQNLLALINDVLDFAKLDSGKMDLQLERQDLSPLITAAISQVMPQAQAKHLFIETDFTAPLPLVYVDGMRFRQVLINLLSNGIKFTRQGTITVSAFALKVKDGASVDRAIKIGHLGDGQWLAISVKDTGIGIARENYEIIFDAFRQVDGSAMREFEGTGLGLAITRQLVEMHGGKVWVESELGHGTAFTVALPIATAPTTASAVSASHPNA